MLSIQVMRIVSAMARRSCHNNNKTPAHPISNVEFLTFTICAKGMDFATLDAGLNKQFLAYIKEKKNISFQMNPYEMVQCQSVR